MIKKLLFTALLFSFTLQSHGQITGSDTACAGYIYTYNAAVAGADSFAWVLPTGWYLLSGAGTSQVQVLCNQNVGQVCVSGFDTAGIFITQYCNPVAWGGGEGWDVQLTQVSFCACPGYTVLPVPNGSGTGCGTCGSGSPSPNLTFGVYDNPWPTGIFINFADGISGIGSLFTDMTYYVYSIDITFGINNAILIEGGACPAVINNSFFIAACVPVPLGITATPDPVCVGDTVTLQYDGGLGPFMSYGWQVTAGNVTLVSANLVDSIQCVINTQGVIIITLQAYDGFACFYWGQISVNNIICNTPPVASFSATTNPICPGTCTDFTNLSTDGDSYEWNFTGASPDTSSAVNPSNICYNTPGSYDVSLIAINANGSDTLSLAGYITVLPYPPSQGIILSGDTLISNTGFASYQWYYNGTLISGATDYYFPITQNGDYNVVCADSNGCAVEAVIFNVMTSLTLTPPMAEEGISLYPNPVHDKLSVQQLNDASEESFTISVYNLIGEMVLAYQPERTGAKSDFGIDVSVLPAGIYYLRVGKDENVFYAKFVKE